MKGAACRASQMSVGNTHSACGVCVCVCVGVWVGACRRAVETFHFHFQTATFTPHSNYARLLFRGNVVGDCNRREGKRGAGHAALFGCCVGQLAARVLILISFPWHFLCVASCFALLLPINNLLHTARRVF